MYELVHQYAPQSPAGRTAIAIVASLIGVPALLLGLFGLSGNVATGLVFLFVSIVALTIAGCLTLGVVRQANEAPSATPLTEPRPDDGAETPIEALRRRFAEGELTDEEFQRRLDQLLETEAVEQNAAESELALER